MRLRRIRAVLTVGLVLAFGAVGAGGVSAGGTESPNSNGALDIDVPATAPAGSTLELRVTGAADDSPVRLVALGSLGQIVLSAPSTSGSAAFVLPVAFTRSAGAVTIVASAGRSVAQAATVLTPGSAVGPVQAVVGARSIVADAADTSMVVTTPVDAWGNAIAEGSEVQISRQSPSGAITTSSTVMSHLLAFQVLGSGTLAGRGLVWITTGDAAGPAVTLDEVAAPPVPFTLEVINPALSELVDADGQTLVPVRTSVLRDPFGNVQADGTEVTIEWTGPEGRSSATAVTIAGIAEFQVQAPRLPGALEFTGFCRGVNSAGSLVLPFGAAVGDVEVSADLVDAGVAIRVGPVTRNGGSVVLDGTDALITVTDEGGARYSAVAELVNGIGQAVVPTATLVGQVTLTVSVLGAQTVETLR